MRHPQQPPTHGTTNHNAQLETAAVATNTCPATSLPCNYCSPPMLFPSFQHAPRLSARLQILLQMPVRIPAAQYRSTSLSIRSGVRTRRGSIYETVGACALGHMRFSDTLPVNQIEDRGSDWSLLLFGRFGGGAMRDGFIAAVAFVSSRMAAITS